MTSDESPRTDVPLPAHHTKHLAKLHYPLDENGTIVVIEQDSADARAKVNTDASSSTGRSIWLGGQILAGYLASLPGKGATRRKKNGSRPIAIDVGSGTGLLAISLTTHGYNVLATDVALLACPGGLLSRNIASNEHLWSVAPHTDAPRVEARVLDWMSLPSSWDFTRQSITPVDPSGPGIACQSGPESESSYLSPPFDLVTSSDSVYSDELSRPLLRTLHSLCTLSASTSPPVYLAIEVRDPPLVQAFLEAAKDEFGFKCAKVDDARIEAVVRPWGWDRTEWDGVQVWKLGLNHRRRAAVQDKGSAG